VVAGRDAADPRTADVPVPDYLAAASRGMPGRDGAGGGDRGDRGDRLAGLRVGYSADWYGDDPGTAPEIVTGIERALGVLEGLGATLEAVTLPRYDLFNACGRVIFAAEAFAAHEEELRTQARSFGRFTYQRIMPGIGISAADLLRAYQLRRRLTRVLDETVFGRCDVLITACGQATAARWDDFGPDWPPPRLASDMQTIPFNVSGHPAASVPIGFAGNGLPIGLQAIGRAFGEVGVFRVAAALEPELGQRHIRPIVPALARETR
jgi:aspartyl-tRNA(Asn)/glutamyl-tRNA(Gln) amidotransferase subunit A